MRFQITFACTSESLPMHFSATPARADQKFSIRFADAKELSAAFNHTNRKLPVRLGGAEGIPTAFKEFQTVTIRKGIEYYEGDYEITPKVEAQTVPTAEKTMRKDLTVQAVPYYEADNDSGTTIFIASEV